LCLKIGVNLSELVNYNTANIKHKSIKMKENALYFSFIDEYNTPLHITINKSTKNNF